MLLSGTSRSGTKSRAPTRRRTGLAGSRHPPRFASAVSTALLVVSLTFQPTLTSAQAGPLSIENAQVETVQAVVEPVTITPADQPPPTPISPTSSATERGTRQADAQAARSPASGSIEPSLLAPRTVDPPEGVPGLPGGVVIENGSSVPASGISPAATGLQVVNAYRAMANLSSVTENATWSSDDYYHSRYMVENNTVTHNETVGNAWYTAGGATAGTNGNVAGGFPASAYSEQGAVDSWMMGPFHQIAIVDPRLTSVGYNAYSRSTAPTPVQWAATLDVLRGRSGSWSTPVMFPANGKSMTLRSYTGNEVPDPLTSSSCSGYTVPTGPAITLQLNGVPSVTSHSISRSGTPLTHCWFDETNYTNSNSTYQTTGRNVLAMRHAIVIMPRSPLTDGTYSVSIVSGGTTYAWSFTVGSVAPPPTLSVSKAGTGSGTVTSSPAGISCGSTCSATYSAGTVITLTASAASGSTFAGWTGCDSSSGATCTLTMNATRSVSATFNTVAPTTRTLTVQKSGAGSGSVTSSPAGISCGSTCSANFTNGTSVTLTASAASGSTFGGWTGCDSTSGASCTVSMTANRTVTADYDLVATSPCTNRPPIRVQVVRTEPYHLTVTTTAGYGYLRQYYGHTMQNTTVEIAGQNMVNPFYATFNVPLTTYTFKIRRTSGIGAATMSMTVTDDCGAWRTFVGGGRSAWW